MPDESDPRTTPCLQFPIQTDQNVRTLYVHSDAVLDRHATTIFSPKHKFQKSKNRILDPSTPQLSFYL